MIKEILKNFLVGLTVIVPLTFLIYLFSIKAFLVIYLVFITCVLGGLIRIVLKPNTKKK